MSDFNPEKYLELARQSIRARQAEKKNADFVPLVADDDNDEDESDEEGGEEADVIRLEEPKEKLKCVNFPA